MRRSFGGSEEGKAKDTLQTVQTIPRKSLNKKAFIYSSGTLRNMLRRYLFCLVEIWCFEGLNILQHINFQSTWLVSLIWEMTKCKGKQCGRIWEGHRARTQKTENLACLSNMIQSPLSVGRSTILTITTEMQF